MRNKAPVDRLLSMLELPAEVSLRKSKLILTGSEELLVYNHQGILIYEPERIVFHRAEGPAAVFGAELTLSELTREGLRIRGQIRGIRLRESCHEN